MQCISNISTFYQKDWASASGADDGGNIVDLHCCVMTDSAESYLNQALAMYERLHGADHTKTLEGKDELARLMIRTDRVEVRSLTAAAVFSC